MENCNTILIDKQQKYQHYHRPKLVNMNISHVNKYYLLMRMIKKTKFSYSPLGKVFQK